MKQFIDATEALGDGPRLRSMLDSDSYLFFPGLLARDRVELTRHEVLVALGGLDWLRSGQPLDLAVPSEKAQPEGVPPVEVYFEAYGAVQRTQSFHELAHEPAVLSAMEPLFDEPFFVQPLKIMRLGVPTPQRWTTPSHQDFPLVDGTVDFLTAWVPLGDCSPDLGGLKILPGSHRAGRREVLTAAGVGAVRVDVDEDDDRFCTTEYAMGDVLIFHSLTVHGALPNTTDRIRLSGDFRYQRVSDPIRAPFLHPHYCPLIPDWDELSKGWTSNRSYAVPDGVVIAAEADKAPITPSLVTLD